MKRKAATALIAVTLAIAGCGESEQDRDGAAASSAEASRSSAAEQRRLEQNEAAASSSSAAAASSSAAAVEASAAAAAAAEAARKVPTVFSGTGDSVVAITKPPGSTVVMVTITGNDSGRYFGVKALDGDRDQLVNTTDPYNGTTLMDAEMGGTTQLQVTAVGPWSITITDLLQAPVLQGSYAGSGDAVLRYDGRRGIAAITGNAEGRYFGVTVYGDGGSTVVNTTDPYTGTVPWPDGPTFATVTAQGEWSISIT